MADPRPQGMGTLKGRVTTICNPEDLYCPINKGQTASWGDRNRPEQITRRIRFHSRRRRIKPGNRTHLRLLPSGPHRNRNRRREPGTALNVPAGQSVNIPAIAEIATPLLGTLSPLATSSNQEPIRH